MVKHTTLHLRTVKTCRSHSPVTGVTNVTSNHDVTTGGQPTENTPDMYSLVDTTEKVVDEQVVDKTLLVSQRNIDSRLTSVNLKDANAPLGNEVENEEEPCFWLQMNLKRCFDKIEFMNKFCQVINDRITHLISEIAKEPEGSQHSKQLHEEIMMPSVGCIQWLKQLFQCFLISI